MHQCMIESVTGERTTRYKGSSCSQAAGINTIKYAEYASVNIFAMLTIGCLVIQVNSMRLTLAARSL